MALAVAMRLPGAHARACVRTACLPTRLWSRCGWLELTSTCTVAGARVRGGLLLPAPARCASSARGPAKGAQLKRYSLAGHSTADGRPGCTVLTSTGHELATDLPRVGGGLDAAGQPVELLLAALLGCKVATAHYVARHLWTRPHHRLGAVRFTSVVAERDERGALALPMTQTPPATAAMRRVRGVVHVRPASAPGIITAADVRRLGELVEERCPVAATLALAGCVLDFEWVLDTDHGHGHGGAV